MQSPIMKVNTVNPQSVIPGPGQVSSVNNFQKGVETAQRQEDRSRRMQREDFDMERAKKSAEREPYDKMLENPAAADMIAQQYGITLDDNMRELLKRPQQAKLALDGAALAKNMGIDNPDAARKFTASYMESGGDMSAAQQSINGMQLNKPDKASYSHLKTVGGSLIDARTGAVIYTDPKANKPELTPLRPGQGLYDYNNKGWAVEPDATEYNKADPMTQFLQSQMGGVPAPMNPVNPNSGRGDASGSPVMPPEKKKHYDSLID